MQKLIPIFALIVIVVVSIALTGCEIESASENNVAITPVSTTILEGQSVEFTASGGYEYTWSFEDSSKEYWGTLSTRTGNKTTYTSMYSPASNATDRTQVLIVTSTLTGSSSTNSYAMTAEAYITHLTPEEEVAESVYLYISPSEVTLTNTQSQIFTAHGGDGFSYSWNLETETYGTLSTRSGKYTTYTSLYDPGTNVVVVQELTVTSGGTNFTAYIKHQ